MLSSRRKLRVLAAFAALFFLAIALGCHGFFVNPTLTTITVTPPTPSIAEGKTQQMVASGSYDDGSTKTITGTVDWTSGDSSIATVTSGGQVKGITAGSTSITASLAGVTGSTNVSITFANLVSITVSPSNTSVSGAGQSVVYTATGHFNAGADQTITTQVTWSVNPSSAATISNAAGTQGNLTTNQVAQSTPVTVTATSGNISGTAQLTIGP